MFPYTMRDLGIQTRELLSGSGSLHKSSPGLPLYVRAAPCLYLRPLRAPWRVTCAIGRGIGSLREREGCMLLRGGGKGKEEIGGVCEREVVRAVVEGRGEWKGGID